MSHRRATTIAIALLSAGLLSSCAQTGPSIEDVAADARTHADELAAQVGEHPEVRRDAITSCDYPGDFVWNAGDQHAYFAGVRTRPGALGRVRGAVADRYRAREWSVEVETGGRTTFSRGDDHMTVYIPSPGSATILAGADTCLR